MPVTFRDLFLGPWAKDIITNPALVGLATGGIGYYLMNKMAPRTDTATKMLYSSIPALGAGFGSHVLGQAAEAAKYSDYTPEQRKAVEKSKRLFDDLAYGNIPDKDPLSVYNPVRTYGASDYSKILRTKGKLDKAYRHTKPKQN